MNGIDDLYDLPTERALLAAIIFDNTLIGDVQSVLHPEDFYLPFHNYAYQGILSLSEKGMPADDIFIKKYLKGINKFDEVAFLELLSSTPITNVKAYSESIKEKANRRKLVLLSTEIKKNILEDGVDSENVFSKIEQTLSNITSFQNNDLKTASQAVDSMLEEIDKMQKLGPDALIGIDTGFSSLNSKTSGFGRGDLVIIAARPSMGKTSLVLNMISKAIDRQEAIVFFSLEMPAEHLMMRLLSLRTGIPLQRVRMGDFMPHEEDLYQKEREILRNAELFIDDSGYTTTSIIKGRLRQIKSKHPNLSMCIIDYLQLMSGNQKVRRQEQISEISRELKQTAREFDIPVIALSQLNRALENRENKRPIMADLRESGAIEQDADIILFVYRGGVYQENKLKEKLEKAKADNDVDQISEVQRELSILANRDEDDVELIIGKQRNGPVGTVDLVFEKRLTKFSDKHFSGTGFGKFDIIIEGPEGNIEASISSDDPYIDIPVI